MPKFICEINETFEWQQDKLDKYLSLLKLYKYLGANVYLNTNSYKKVDVGTNPRPDSIKEAY